MFRNLVTKELAHRYAASAVRFVNDDELVTGAVDGSLTVWKLGEADLSPIQDLHTTKTDSATTHDGVGAVVSMDICVAGSLIVISTLDSGLQVMPMDGSAQTQKLLPAHNRQRLLRALFNRAHPNEIFVSTSSGSAVRYQVPSGNDAPAEAEVLFQGSKSLACAMDISVDGTYVGLGHSSGHCEVMSVATRELKFQHKFTHRVTALGFLPWDTDLLLVGCSDCRVYLFDVLGGELMHVFGGHTSQIQALIPNPAGQYFSTADITGKLRIWDVESRECAHQWDFGSPILDLAHSSDGTKLAVTDAAGGVHICLVATPITK